MINKIERQTLKEIFQKSIGVLVTVINLPVDPLDLPFVH